MTSGDDPPDTETLTREFADALTATLNAVLDNVPPITVERREPRFFVAPHDLGDELEPVTTIPLTINGKRRLNLRVEMYCTLDSRNQYLTVDESKIALELPDTRAAPLFRFEYVRASPLTSAAAHIQVHAHRDEIVYLASMRSRFRAKDRAERAERGRMPLLSELHIPVGGHRFRPCAEDVLEFVAEEFGIDTKGAWRDAVQRGRADWRRKQTATVVRDSPHEAVRALTEMGYEVTPPSEPPPERVERLTAF
jgi:hypothetical protein